MLKVSTLSFRAGIAADSWDSLSSPRLTGAVYRHFLRNVLPELLQDVDLQTRIYLWFMHDGAPHIFILQFGNS
jgi:hypothetical protein